MDKHEYRLKTEQMLKYIESKSFDKALEIAESIDWRKVKNASILCAASEIYECCGDLEKSKDMLFLAYDVSPDSKRIVFRLGMLALKQDDVKEAVDCYEEFVAMAPKDPNRFVLKYKILQCKGASVEEQIAVLEDFKKVEYVEKWAFELAKLYEKAGMISECMEECDDLMLWFNEGKYIYKAMELKMQYKPLTPLQQEKYKKHQKVVEEDMQGTLEENKETEIQEEIQSEVQEAEVSEEKPANSIEQMVQDWQEHQKENAQMIQAEIEKVQQEKEQQEAQAQPEEEEKEEILSDDVRKLMEELEAESAEINAQKTVGGEVPGSVAEEAKPLLQKVVEQLSALDTRQEAREEAIAPQTEPEMTQEEEIEIPDPDEGIKLGDTQSMALSAKALSEAARVEIPEITIPEEPVSIPEPTFEYEPTGYDTGFVVQGRYDLDAQSQIGLQAGLTEEQKKLFSYFVPVHGMSEQIVKALHEDRACTTRYGTSKTGNLIIVGRRGSGKTVLAVNMVKAIQKARRMKQGKVAIVKAEALNKKNISEIVEKIRGGALVIEKASRLKRETIDNLCNVMEGQTGEMLVVLEDERKPMDRMLGENVSFKRKFTSRIDVPVFINDELVTFGQTYAKENGYKIDEMGILALYSDIDVLQREEKVVTVSDVKAIIDDAIENANRPSLKKLFKKLLGKNRDDSDRVILKEEDFR